MDITEIPACPFCEAEGKKTNGSSSSSFSFAHEVGCFLAAYVFIQDYQIKAWCRRSGKSYTSPLLGRKHVNKAAFKQLIDEDTEWLLKQPRSLERDHIDRLLKDASRVYYGDSQQ